MPSTSLTQLAHSALRETLMAGDFAVDATAGNGHDTAFLADAVGVSGRVIALDIQQVALDAVRLRLEQLNLFQQVTLFLRGHEHLGEVLPACWCGMVAAVMFNLGYLPCGDHALVTRPETTIPALESAVGWLRNGGMLSVLVYPRHLGGEVESDAVQHWLNASPSARALQWAFHGDPAGKKRHPWLALGKRISLR
ncbi:MAG: SAM-dependent methyltransferase [Puniceicoccales bacterium]|nr:SAM-dependent methyltransferase [Puniceicoccales bacterium]